MTCGHERRAVDAESQARIDEAVVGAEVEVLARCLLCGRDLRTVVTKRTHRVDLDRGIVVLRGSVAARENRSFQARALRYYGLTAALLALLLAGTARADLVAVTVGDSIVRSYPEPHPYGVPIQGWGARLGLFRPDVAWVNRAVGGTSTKTFLEKGYWAAALAEDADYVLIQFGYGDASGPPEHTDPETTYRANLHRMVVEARAAGAEPILVTPAGLRTVGFDGVHVHRPNGLEVYAAAMTSQAAEDGVHLIDMQAWSLATYDAVGFPEAQEVFGFTHPEGWEDRLHFGYDGATYAAGFVASRLPPLVETAAPGVSVFPYEESP